MPGDGAWISNVSVRGRKRVHPGAASMCQVMVRGFPMFQCYYNYIRGRKRVHPGAASMCQVMVRGFPMFQ